MASGLLYTAPAAYLLLHHYPYNVITSTVNTVQFLACLFSEEKSQGTVIIMVSE